jgi:hypothetical protein
MNQNGKNRANRDRKKIVRCIENVIHFWLEGDFARIAPYLARDIVMYLPHMNYRIYGGKEALLALRTLRQKRDIQRYCDHDFTIDTNGDLSIATYRYTFDYVWNNQRSKESGFGLVVFEYRKEKWVIIRWSLAEAVPVIHRPHSLMKNHGEGAL